MRTHILRHGIDTLIIHEKVSQSVAILLIHIKRDLCSFTLPRHTRKHQHAVEMTNIATFYQHSANFSEAHVASYRYYCYYSCYCYCYSYGNPLPAAH